VDNLVNEVRAARRDLDLVIEEIRAVSGYEDFLAPPTFADITGVAAEQPLVYLAAAEPGGLALVVRGDEVEHIDLPELALEAVQDRSGTFLEAYDRYRRRPDDADEARAWSSALDEITAWLWPAAMGPVVDRFGAPAPDAGGAADAEPPGMVIVPGGMLGLLPLHAAWTPDDRTATGRRYALDLQPISYAPNARSLAAARSVAVLSTGERLLAVDNPQPQPPGTRLLTETTAEVACAAARFRAAGRQSVTLSGAEATLERVSHELANADVVHFACHGSALLDSPLDSSLSLAHGEALTLRALLGMRLQARLAVLSACESSRPGTDLPDEVVSLPAGLLQAGVAGVVATLWGVDDLAAAMVMVEFYRCWQWSGLTPAQALRRAQLWVRDSTNEEKFSLWERAEIWAAPWLPPPARELAAQVMMRPDWEARDDAPLSAWSAFVHVGA